MQLDYAPKLNNAEFDEWATRFVDTLRVGEFEIQTLNVTNYATINQYRLGQVGAWDITENTIQNGTIVLDSSQNRITVDTIVLDGAENEIRIGGTQVKLDADAQVISINSGTYGAQGIQLDYNSGTPRAYIGDGSNQYFQFDGTNVSWKGTSTSLTTAGAFTASNATITGTITATAGAIGGWTIGATTIYSTNLTIDSGNERIRSANYVSGYAGAGFTLEPNLLEVGNIACRGIFRTAVFQKDVYSVIGGNVIVRPGDVLATDMTAADASTLTVEGNETFAVNDVLRIKDGTDDEWFLVTNVGSAPTYTVTRDQAAAYTSDANPTWKKGASVTNYGASGSGGVLMTSSETNAPYMSIFSHAGSPWSTLTTKLRVGNLNGFIGYSSDLYGIAIGEANKYLKYDSSGGLQVKGDIAATGMSITGTATVRSLLQIESTGSMRSNVTGQYPYLEFSNSGLQLKDADTGGTYGTATYTTAAQYGFGATVWLMNSHYFIPWMEVKEPQDGSANDMPSIRFYDRSADPTGGTYAQGDVCMVNGYLRVYRSGSWEYADGP